MFNFQLWCVQYSQHPAQHNGDDNWMCCDGSGVFILTQRVTSIPGHCHSSRGIVDVDSVTHNLPHQQHQQQQQQHYDINNTVEQLIMSTSLPRTMTSISVISPMLDRESVPTMSTMIDTEESLSNIVDHAAATKKLGRVLSGIWIILFHLSELSCQSARTLWM